MFTSKVQPNFKTAFLVTVKAPPSFKTGFTVIVKASQTFKTGFTVVVKGAQGFKTAFMVIVKGAQGFKGCWDDRGKGSRFLGFFGVVRKPTAAAVWPLTYGRSSVPQNKKCLGRSPCPVGQRPDGGIRDRLIT